MRCSLQALKKARSRRHWTCVIRPNMAARALGHGSAPGRPGAARLGFEADNGLGVRRGFRQSLPDFRRGSTTFMEAVALPWVVFGPVDLRALRRFDRVLSLCCHTVTRFERTKPILRGRGELRSPLERPGYGMRAVVPNEAGVTNAARSRADVCTGVARCRFRRRWRRSGNGRNSTSP